MKEHEKMKRILVDAHVFDEDYFQGTTSYIKGLYADNHLVDVTFAARNKEKIQQVFGTKSKVRRLWFRSSLLRLLIDFPRIWFTGGYDFVHFQYIGSPILMRKSVVTIHDVLFNDFPEYFPSWRWHVKNLLYRYSYLRARCICTVSDYSLGRLKFWYGERPNVCVTENMYNGDLEKQQNPGVTGQFVLAVARDEPRKRLDLVVKLASKITCGQVVIVSNSDRYVGMPNVKVFKGIPQSQLNWLYANCHFSVFPSECEGFGMPVVESLLSGRAVLVRRASAMSTLKIPGHLYFSTDDEFLELALLFWKKPHSENKVNFKAYSDWTVAQKALLKNLR